MTAFRPVQRLLANIRILNGAIRRKPRLLKRLIRGYVGAHFRRDPAGSLRIMDVALGYTCNFRCQHCSSLVMDRGREEKLSLEDYRRVAQQAMDMGVMLFHFTGGEPLIRKDIFDVIRAFRPHENLISIQSNGWFVTEAFLDEYRAVGGDFFCVSLDSAEASLHDGFRAQSGAWERAISALRMAKKKGFRVMMSSVVTHQNLDSEDMARMIALAKELGATMELNLAVPVGEWRGNTEDLLDAEDRVKLNRMLKKHRHVRTDFESNWRIEGCPAFKEKCYLTPYGDMLPCPFIQVAFGNVREKSVAEIQRQALSHPYLRTYYPICIAAEDKHFISNAGCYTVASQDLPVQHEDSPLFGGVEPTGRA